MRRFSRWLFGKSGGEQDACGDSSSSSSNAKSDAQLQSESKRIVRFQGVALVFLSKVRDDVHSGQAARGVELVVAEEDLSDVVKAGATIRRDGANPDGSFFGEVAYVDGTVQFQDAQVRPKARLDWSTEDVAEQHVLPLTMRQRAFMLDKIPQDFVGPLFKGVFVSQARQCRFGDLVAALEHHFRGQDPAKVFVWLDLFSANQPLLTNPDEELPGEVVTQRDSLLTSGLHEAIKRFDERLIFFDKWNDPAPLRRSWCVWEILGALSGEHRDLRPIFAPGQDDAFLEVLLDDADNVTQAVADIDTRKATCFKAEDKAMITREIERTLTQGFVTLNAVILASLRDWLAEITHAAVDRSRATDGKSIKHGLVCSQAGYFCYSQGAMEQALRYYEEALEVRREELGDRHRNVAETLNNIAAVYHAQAAHDKALRYYEEALEISRENVGDRHPLVAAALNNIGQVYNAQGAYEEALRYYEEALEIWKEKLGDRHPHVATTLNNIAAVYKAQGASDGALRYYEEALGIRREKLGDRHPSVATTLFNVGSVYRTRGKWSEALKFFEEAFAIRLERLGADHLDTESAKSSVEECKEHL